MKKLIPLVALLALVTFIFEVIAQEKPTSAPGAPGKPKIEKFSGVIEKVDDTVKTISVTGRVGTEEKILTFDIGGLTKITGDKGNLSYADLKEADLKKAINVSVEYYKLGDRLLAVAVKVGVPKAPPKKE